MSGRYTSLMGSEPCWDFLKFSADLEHAETVKVKSKTRKKILAVVTKYNNFLF